MSSDFGVTRDAALIILGDCGLNFWLNKTDQKEKQRVEKQLVASNSRIYCVHGNHEERPEYLGYPIVHDSTILGDVFCEPEYPNIKYLIDGHVYWFNDQRTLVLGGAYSVDKWYRLGRAGITSIGSHDLMAKKAGWFDNEQLSDEVKLDIFQRVQHQSFDMVLSHTCPYSWMPRDLFLNGLDQSTIDNSTEHWLEEIKLSIFWKRWLFGHFHDDRVVRPDVYMLYRSIINLNDLIRSYPPFDAISKKDPKYEE